MDRRRSPMSSLAKERNLDIHKSCLFPAGIVGTDFVKMMRVNISPEVPVVVFSSGYLIEEFKATETRGYDVPWTLEFGEGQVVPIIPGPGRLSRLGFVTFETRPQAALFLLPNDER